MNDGNPDIGSETEERELIKTTCVHASADAEPFAARSPNQAAREGCGCDYSEAPSPKKGVKPLERGSEYGCSASGPT